MFWYILFFLINLLFLPGLSVFLAPHQLLKSFLYLTACPIPTSLSSFSSSFMEPNCLWSDVAVGTQSEQSHIYLRGLVLGFLPTHATPGVNVLSDDTASLLCLPAPRQPPLEGKEEARITNSYASGSTVNRAFR